MQYLYDLKEKLCTELDEIARRPDMGAGDLELAHKLTDTIKNIDKICMLEEDGYSEAMEYGDGGPYGGGSSYANRGKHFVRGHYSRDGGGGQGGYSSRRGGGRGGYSRNGGYSREDGRSEMMEHLEMAMETANEQDRENIRRWMRQLENA